MAALGFIKSWLGSAGTSLGISVVGCGSVGTSDITAGGGDVGFCEMNGSGVGVGSGVGEDGCENIGCGGWSGGAGAGGSG